MPFDNSLRELGRSVAQLHIKLSRIDGRLTTDTPSAPHAAELEVLLDLVDAVESAIERREPERGWFRRAQASADDLWRGLAIAVADARERLGSLGIEEVPVEGAFDSTVHRVIEVVPPSGECREGTLAATYRRGWLRREGSERVVLRTAQVSVHGMGQQTGPQMNEIAR